MYFTNFRPQKKIHKDFQNNKTILRNFTQYEFTLSLLCFGGKVLKYYLIEHSENKILSIRKRGWT